MANANVSKIKLLGTTYDIKDNSGTKSTHTHTKDQITDFPVIPTKDSDLTNDRYVRFDTNSQGLSATQKSNARTNIGAGTSNFTGYTSEDPLSTLYIDYEGDTLYDTIDDIYSDLSGKLNKTGGTMTGNLIVNARHRDNYYASNLCRHFYGGTPTQFVIKTKIKYVSSAQMPVIRIYGYAYGEQSPIELRVGFYIYDDTLGWAGAVSTGAWKPEVYLFRYTENSTNYVAVGFKGACYFCGFQVDAQVGALGQFDSNFSIDGWSTTHNGADTTQNIIPSVGTDKCVQVSYRTMKTDISGSASKLTTDAGSASKPVYFSNGVPVACSTSLTDYLPLSGGTISNGTNSDPLAIKGLTNSYVRFENSSGTILGYLGASSGKKPIFNDGSGSGAKEISLVGHTHSAIDITISDIGSYTNVKQAIGDLNNRLTAVETALDGLLARLTAI